MENNNESSKAFNLFLNIINNDIQLIYLLIKDPKSINDEILIPVNKRLK